MIGRPVLRAAPILLAATLLAATPVQAKPLAVKTRPAPAAPSPRAPPLASSPFDLCDEAINAARTRAVPPTLLPAIARVESGRLDPATGRVRPWPWTINVDGAGSFFATKAEAVAAVVALQARGVRSIDVGCMQVNLRHHPAAFPSLDAAFDPAANAAYAMRFLGSLHAQTNDWNLATAMYHSQTQERGEDYQRRVFGRVMTPMGATVTPAGPYAVWPPPGVVFGAMPPPSYAYGAFAIPPPAAPAARHAPAAKRR